MSNGSNLIGEHGGDKDEGSGTTWQGGAWKVPPCPSGPQSSQLKNGRAGNTDSSSDLPQISSSVGVLENAHLLKREMPEFNGKFIHPLVY